MEKKEIITTLKTLREVSPKRKFKQSVDLVINLKGLNLKRPDHNIDQILALVHPSRPQVKVCALVGSALEKKAGCCQKVILDKDFAELKKKDMKILVKEFDFFIGQGDIMPKIATTFGKYLGPKKKMPNPKLGAIIPPTGEVKPVYDKLQKTVHLMTKNEASVKASLGLEDYPEEHIAENAMVVYNAVIHDLPQEGQNIRAVFLKFTMGPSVKIGETREDFEKRHLVVSKADKAEELVKKVAKPKVQKASVKKRSAEDETV